MKLKNKIIDTEVAMLGGYIDIESLEELENKQNETHKI